MSKVSAADATWDERRQVSDGEWHRKSKGGFTRMVMSPNKETAEFADGFVEFTLFSVQCLPRERAPLFWGSGNLHSVDSEQYFHSLLHLSATHDSH